MRGSKKSNRIVINSKTAVDEINNRINRSRALLKMSAESERS